LQGGDPAAANSLALSVRGLSAGYSKALSIVNDISVSAAAQSMVAVLGPNGSGKSTLLKAIMGIAPESQGVVSLRSEELQHYPTYQRARRGLGYVPQSRNVFASLSVLENLETAGLTSDKRFRNEQVNRVLTMFPVFADIRLKRAGELSAGQRNLLGVARALMQAPAALLVDEPTAGLAPNSADLMWHALRDVANAGAAVVVVEQNVKAALDHCDTGYVLVAGRNRLEGSTQELSGIDLASIFLGISVSRSTSPLSTQIHNDSKELRN
jgi:branched-chain amino acid transport system ATP-binding protein